MAGEVIVCLPPLDTPPVSIYSSYPNSRTYNLQVHLGCR
jgi:hypothetical protein